MRIAVCLAPSPRWAEVDALTGEVSADERVSQLSDADAAALEVALRIAERWGAEVTALTVGPLSAEPALRTALACGAARAVRIHEPGPNRAEEVAAALAGSLGGVDLACCGDQGPEGGSGAVPAFVAAELRVASALGLIDVRITDDPGRLEAVRRLDGARREHLVLTAPAVLSVEGATAVLRRASLPALVRAGRARIEVLPAPVRPTASAPTVRIGVPRPYRPRPRVVQAPVGDTVLDRVRALTGAGAAPTHERRAPVVADPEAAAGLVLDALARWGYEPAAQAQS